MVRNNSDKNNIIINNYLIEPKVFGLLKTQINKNNRLNNRINFYKNKVYNSNKDVKYFKDKYQNEKEYNEELEEKLKKNVAKAIILVTNNIRNIWTEWPLGQSGFESFIVNKYGSVATAQSGVYRYLAKQDIYI